MGGEASSADGLCQGKAVYADGKALIWRTRPKGSGPSDGTLRHDISERQTPGQAEGSCRK